MFSSDKGDKEESSVVENEKETETEAPTEEAKVEQAAESK